MAQTELKFKVVVDSSGMPRLEQDMAKSFGGIQSKLSGILLGIGSMFTATAIYGSVKNAMAFASDIRDTAEAFNVSTDSLQAFQVAMSKAGVPMDKLQLAFNAVQNAQGELMNGNLKMIPLLDQLGISAKKFANSTPDQVLEMFGQRLSTTTTYAQDFNAILQLIPMRGAGRFMSALKEIGTEGLPQMTEAFKSAGLIMDNEYIKRLDEAQKKTEQVSRYFKILWGESLGWWADLFVTPLDPATPKKRGKPNPEVEIPEDAAAKAKSEKDFYAMRERREKSQSDLKDDMAKQAADYAEDQLKMKVKLEDAEAGKGISLSGGLMADRLARIGGYVGGQLDPNARAAERQIRILEEIRDVLRSNKNSNPMLVEDY